MTKLSLTNKKLVGILNQSSQERLVVMLHGFTGDKDGNGAYVMLEQTLADAGISSLRFDFSGEGDSPGNFSQVSVEHEVEEFHQVLEFIKERGYEQIGVVGESMGGTVAVAGFDQMIASLVLWYPAFDLEDTELSELLAGPVKEESAQDWGLSPGQQFGSTFFDEIVNLKLYDNLKSIHCPTLIVHGDQDEDVPLAQSQKAMEYLSDEKEMIVVPGDGHCLRDHHDQLVEWTTTWFQKHL